jgi:hypothetical protein
MSTLSFTQFRAPVEVPRTPTEWEVQERRSRMTAARLAALASDCRRHGMDAVLPARPEPGGRTAAELRAWIKEADAEAERVEATLREHLTVQALQSIRAAEGQSLDAAVLQSEAPAAAEDRGAVIARYLAEHLSPAVGPAEREAIVAGLGDLGADTWRDELSLRIGGANAAIAELAANREAAAQRLSELEEFATGAPDEERDTVATALTEAVATGALPPELLGRAASVLDRSRRAAAASAVPEHLEAVLAELGYRVEPVQPNITRGPRLWDVTHPDWHDHEVKVAVTPGGELRTELIRTGDGEPGTDRERAEAWCAATRSIQERAQAAGLEFEETYATEPGTLIRNVERRAETGRTRAAEAGQRERRP